MKIQKLTCEKARNISIVKTLENLGHFPKKKSKKEAWFLSPFRSETQASFKVSIKLNRWYDHGAGKGGNLIDLLIQLKGFSISEVLTFLNNDIDSFSFHQQAIFSNLPVEEKTYEIIKIKSLENKILLSYLKSRKINELIAKKYCHEVYYKIKNKTYFAIAFKNDSEGIEIRNKYFKGALGTKDNTWIENGSKTLSVFEGFIDFLSYLTLKEMPKRKENYLILNSISLIEKALPKLKEYNNIFTYLDNDNAGIAGTKIFKNLFKNSIDCSFVYNKYNDLNGYLSAMVS